MDPTIQYAQNATGPIGSEAEKAAFNASFGNVVGIIGFVIMSQVVIEVITYNMLYNTEEYKDLAERTRNLGKKI